VLPLAHIARVAEEIAKTTAPSEPGVRWTPGVAFPVKPPAGTALHDVYRARLWWTTDGRSVGVLKRDIIDDRGRLDPKQRLGGWGAVSSEIERQLKGKWTSRSLRVVEGLLAKADEQVRRAARLPPRPSAAGPRRNLLEGPYDR
jgi:hypothetical protein